LSPDATRIDLFFDPVDKYLIADLETMVNDVPDKESGGLGYPALFTIIVGMELLGWIVSDTNGRDGFGVFWDRYFAVDHNEYSNPSLKDIFRDSIRNGIGHYYLLKKGIQLTKSSPLLNLTRLSDGGLNIDLKALYPQFLQTYERIKKEISPSGNAGSQRAFDAGYDRLAQEIKSSQYVEKIKEFAKDLRAYSAAVGASNTLEMDDVTRSSAASGSPDIIKPSAISITEMPDL
jgi:hypothetical protein